MKKAKKSRVREAAEAYVRANYHFRFGSRKFSNEATDWLTAAEDELFLAVTGEKDPVHAAEALGIDHEKEQEEGRRLLAEYRARTFGEKPTKRKKPTSKKLPKPTKKKKAKKKAKSLPKFFS